MTAKTKLEASLKETLSELGLEASASLLEPADLKHADYASSVALVLAKKAGETPQVLSEKIAAAWQVKLGAFAELSVAGPGFINAVLSRRALSEDLNALSDTSAPGAETTRTGERVLFEYTDPNPFKAFHIGHVMSNTVGEALSRLAAATGAEVKRANYQGDVGMHVAKAVWGMMQDSGNFPADDDSLSMKVEFLGNAYAFGASAYEESEEAQVAIKQVNKALYVKDNEEYNRLYQLGREWSLEKFEDIYRTLGTHFDYYFFESQVMAPGMALVKKFLAEGVFTESEGAVVFKGEEVDPSLHTRVFINSEGLPTYEAKELGLAEAKLATWNFTHSITITAEEQRQYMRVVKAAMERVVPDYAVKFEHITHGMLRLTSGKMSSRTGDVITGESLIAEMIKAALEKMAEREYGEEERQEIAEAVAVAAIKYAILKQAPGKDIIFDPEASLSFEGDSGPYLQYAVVRASSVLEKAATRGEFSPEELPRDLERLLVRWPEVVARAEAERSPQFIVTYLTELASSFNSLYAAEKFIDEAAPERAGHLLKLASVFESVMTYGLSLLGIRTPKRM